MVRSYNTPNKWVFGTIVSQLGNMHYEVNVNGNVTNVKVSLSLKEGATPKFCAPRPIPFALQAPVEQEIRR